MTTETGEAETLEAFVASARRRQRLIGVLQTKKRRTVFDTALSHEDLWDPRYVVRLPAEQHTAKAIGELLRERGAPSICRILGGRHDGEQMELADALDDIVGALDACLVICLPARLAYHESEEPGRRVVLARS